ncbi:MAG: 50S ribosomal protein L23 [Verrucomicrobiales bacterium]|jgi:large subunit ribosomal protein L23|nr:50S ribosomal protein L23 [Verrucomicrobiales bacterium]MBA18673.1 50S ribosomal protein L23 [Verrucomicrobiales bacterium]|tara:strand:- start:1155 stop:1490 length:336 start_codon:yes stop_codon:yes gene_type:complete
MSPFDVIKTVRLTEKVMAVQERCDEMAELSAKKKGTKAVIRQQVHLVANSIADKNDIRRAVEILFKVKVDRVNTMNVNGRLRRKRTRHEGRTAKWKKAIVTLKEGDQITLT